MTQDEIRTIRNAYQAVKEDPRKSAPPLSSDQIIALCHAALAAATTQEGK